MGTGTSACNCMRTINRTRFTSHHAFPLPTSSWDHNRRESLLRPRRHVHATHRTTSSPRDSLQTKETTAAAAGTDTALRTHRSRPLWSHSMPTNVHDVRGYFTSTSSSKSVAVDSSQQIGDTSNESDLLSEDEALIFEGLRRDGWILLQEEGRAKRESSKLDRRRKACRATLKIPGTDIEFEARAGAPQTWRARSMATLRLVSELKGAGVWKDLIQKHQELSNKKQVDVEPLNLKLADLDPADVSRELQILFYLQSRNNWLVEDIYCRRPGSTGFTCIITLQFHLEGSTRTIRTDGQGEKIRSARQEALCKQIMKLKKIGLWDKLLREAPRRTRRGFDKFHENIRMNSQVKIPESSSEPSPTDLSDAHPFTDLVKVPSSSEDPRAAFGSEETELLQIFQKMTETSALFQLDMKMTGSFTCHVVLSMLDRNAVVEATISASQEEEAKKLALLHLISKLQEQGLWEDLLHATLIPPKAEVAIHDDLFYNMQWVKVDLLHAENALRKTLPMQTTQATTQTTELESSRPIGPGYRKWRSSKLAAALAKFREAKNPRTVAARSARATLPVTDYREAILDRINKATYSIVVAETGSGKSTQVPQMILENATDQGNGGDCKVLCVQPRRLAALFLARRVAWERREAIGDSVGYAVRFDAYLPANSGSITYCTTGVMLNYLKGWLGGVEQFSHILLDEVHVRDMGIDLTMLLLRRHVDLCRKLGKPAPKIVLMSATLDIEHFSSYFRNEGPDGALLPAPHISIPGRQYHVQRHYLSEVLESVGSSIRPGVLSSFLSDGTTNEFLKRHREFFPAEDEMGLEAESDINSLLQEFSKKESKKESLTNALPKEPNSPQANVDDDVDSAVPHALITATIFHLLQQTQTGAILVFVPGLQHILELRKKLSFFGTMLNFDMTDTNRFRILTLHSLVPEGQQELSHEVPEGCRRILLATDIAEASLTIPDVRYVIDSGRVNRLVYDNRLRSSKLECHWVSRSSALQRAGRAGRVENGHYYFIGDQRLFNSLPVTTQPEFLRGNLQDVCLATKVAVPNTPLSDLLQQTLDPPHESSVRAAIDSLKWLKAFDEHENITNLGRILALFPLQPAFGKLVLMGVIFRCLDPMLIIATVGSGSDIFRLGFTEEEKKQVMRDRATFAGGSSSDHIAEVNAFQAVRHIWLKEGLDVAQNFAASSSIYPDSSRKIYNVANHLLRILVQQGLIRRMKKPKPDSDSICGPEFNTNSQNIPLIKALLLHCLSPQIAAPVGRTLKEKYCTQEDEKPITFSRRSISLRPKTLPLALVTYSRKTEGTESMKLNDNSLISPLAVCLFGGNLAWENGSFMLNDWLKIGLNAKDVSVSREEAARSMVELQAALDKSLTTMTDSLLLRSREAVTDEQLEKSMYVSRRELNACLERAVTNVFNRDTYRVESREESMPAEWEAPELDDDFEPDEEPVTELRHGIQ